jgi:predicted transcriptional regulator
MRQGLREKLSVTIDPRLYRAVERHAKRAKVTKSRVVEEAIRVFERSRVAALAREGYREMATDDVADAEAYLPGAR